VCLDSQSEVLTDGGWRFFKDLNGAESIATVNMVTDQIEYQLPTRLIDAPYKGDMFRFGGHKLDALVTPNHRMVVYPPKENETFITRKAEDLLAWDRIKLHAKWTGEQAGVVLVPAVGGGHHAYEKELDPHAFAEFLGWYVAEGSSCHGKAVCPGKGYWVTVSQTHSMKRIMLGSLLQQLPWKFHPVRDGFQASSKQLSEYLAPLGPDCYSKRVPEWIKRADTETIRRFMMGAVLGDGWSRGNGSKCYCTTSRLLADDMQELFMKLGVTASVTKREPAAYTIRGRRGIGTCPVYVVNEMIHPRAGLRNHDFRPNYDTVPYDGRVYCATVPNGTLITRRNGSPMITGNCLEYFASRDDLTYVPAKTSLPQDNGDAKGVMRFLMKQLGIQPKSEGDSIYCGAGSAP
jgi:replicative DNA helicase Mcm